MSHYKSGKNGGGSSSHLSASGGGSPMARVWDSFASSMTNLNPPGSLRASTLTVITGMVGGGTLTLSLAIKKAGMLMGLFYMVALDFMAAYSCYVLVFCAERNKCPSFRSLAKRLYGDRAATFIQMMLLLALWSACVSYMTLVKNLLANAMDISFGSHFWDKPPILLFSAIIVVVLPLALMRKVSALRYASMTGLIILCFMATLVMALFFTWCDGRECDWEEGDEYCDEDRRCLAGSLKHHDLVNTHVWGHPYTIAIVLGGFAAHPTVLPIYYEMQKRSPTRMRRCIIYGFGLTLFLYMFIAYFGYFTFPNSVEPNLLSSDYRHNSVMLVAATLLCLYVISVVPLFAHAFRKSLTELLVAKKKSGQKTKKRPLLMDESSGSTDVNESGSSVTDGFKDIVNDPAAYFSFVPTLTPTTQRVYDRAILREAEEEAEEERMWRRAQHKKSRSKKKKSSSRGKQVPDLQVLKRSSVERDAALLPTRSVSPGPIIDVSQPHSGFSLMGAGAHSYTDGIDEELDEECTSTYVGSGSASSSMSSDEDAEDDVMQFGEDPQSLERAADAAVAASEAARALPANQLPLKQHVTVTLAFVFSAMAVAMVADNIGVVNSILGSTTLPMCCFLFPCAAVWRTKQASRTMRIISTTSAVLVSINAVLNLYTLFFK